MGSLSTPRNIEATFIYYGPLDRNKKPEKDDHQLFGIEKDVALVPLPVQDIRSAIGDVQTLETPEEIVSLRTNLETYGFTAFKHETAFLKPPFDRGNWKVNALVNQYYYPEINASVRKLLGATFVQCGQCHLRDILQFDEELLKKQFHELPNVQKKSDIPLGPVKRVHVDYSPSGAWKLLQNLSHWEGVRSFGKEGLVPEAAKGKIVPPEDYQGRRWAMFSFWRPLKPVKRDALALCDTRSVNHDEDFVERITTYRTKSTVPGEPELFEGAYYLTRPPETSQHSWYWLPDHQPDEVVLIKLFDSHAGRLDELGNKISGPSPHSSIAVEGTLNEEIRESMEVRLMAVW